MSKRPSSSPKNRAEEDDLITGLLSMRTKRQDRRSEEEAERDRKPPASRTRSSLRSSMRTRRRETRASPPRPSTYSSATNNNASTTCSNGPGTTSTTTTVTSTDSTRSTTGRVPPPASKGGKKATWLQSYEELKSYRAQHGDCLVPRSYLENPRLGSWVAEQRKQYKLALNGKPASITEYRIKLLNELEFDWNVHESAWRRQLQDFRAFREEYGHCHVPLHHERYPKLGLWTKEQRRHYNLMQQGKPSHMTQQRIDELNEVGFVWDTHEAIFSEHLRELADYKAEHGHCAVPTNYQPNPRLACWCQHQRRQYKRYKEGKGGAHSLTAERIEALNKLEFVWNPRQELKPSSSLLNAGASSPRTPTTADDAGATNEGVSRNLSKRSRRSSS